MIVARCKDCNYTARYNSNYFSILELKKYTMPFSSEQNECVHSMIYSEEEKQ